MQSRADALGARPRSSASATSGGRGGRQAVEDEGRHLSRGRRVEVRQNDDHIPAVRLEREVPVHPWRAPAVPDESPAAHDAVEEPIRVSHPLADRDLAGEEQRRVRRIEELVLTKRDGEAREVPGGGVPAPRSG